jgi:hypothetical protein
MALASVGGPRQRVRKVSTMARHCLVSGHTGPLSQDIVDRPAAAEGLGVAVGIQG